jgi:class 3 adenylate cyclase
MCWLATRSSPATQGGEDDYDGVHAAFDEALMRAATVDLQQALADPARPAVPLRVRCGLHAGVEAATTTTSAAP